MKTVRTLPGCVYHLTFPNGKCYIGMSEQRFNDRWRAHKKMAKRGSPLLIHRAIRKYGEPVVQIIGEGLGRDAAMALEVEAIAAFNTKAPAGYNLTDGGEGTVGWFDAADEDAQTAFRKKSSDRLKAMWADGRLSVESSRASSRMPEVREGRSQRMALRMNSDAEFRNIALDALLKSGAEANRQKQKPIVLVCLGTESVFPSLSSAAKHLSVSPGSISSAAKTGTLCKGHEVHVAI